MATTDAGVFVSYKREDESRAQVLVAALDKAGIRVWWDRGIPAAARWRSDIELALENARVVVVLWTDASTGPEGDFVREEAERGKRRGVLVPVRFDDVRIPLGFGELQT